MAYANTYETTDITAIIVDILAGLGVILVGFAGIIGIIALFRWFQGRTPLPKAKF